MEGKQITGRRAVQAEKTGSAKSLRWTVLIEAAARRIQGLEWASEGGGEERTFRRQQVVLAEPWGLPCGQWLSL